MRGSSVRALSQGHIFRKSTHNNGTQRREHVDLMTAYKQRVDVVTEGMTRRFFTFCDVQAEGVYISNTTKHLYE